MKETVLIVGDSPFLGSLESHLSYLIDKYPTIGINNIVTKHKINTHIFLDEKFIFLSNMYPEVKRVTLFLYGDAVLPKKELYNSYTFNFKMNTAEDIFLNEKLAWCGFTHDYAVSYAIMKGYKRIILVGAADFMDGGHYITNEKFRYSQKLKPSSKRFIEDIASQKALIYTLNPDSALDVPRISIDELLS